MEGDGDNNNNMDMVSDGGGGGGGTTLSSSSRWNPTKEQINMLESLYAQGIRTPSAEQIQQITTRLRAYGHIEGKNVFYWFQNHKARQRQKQKQERTAFINRYLHKSAHQPAPLFPPSTNVVCGPYYLPRNDLGFYPQCTKVLIPGGSKMRAKTDQEMDKTTSYVGVGYDPEQPECNVMMHTSNINNSDISNQETLPLFPLHPTGILQAKTNAMLPSNSLENSITPCIEKGPADQPFFDFFSGQGCERTD
ncbi:hypothetical protein CUMW_034280 [Citrus unshiu]|nr:hypothetical protein CUMW_034280 [Citrus unshiu]